MNLARHFDKPARLIKMMPDGVLGHGLDDGIFEALATEIFYRPLDQLTPESAASPISSHSQIRNSSPARLRINARRDIAHDLSLCFGHKDSVGIDRNIFVHMPRFAPAPVVLRENSELLLDILLKGN